MKSEANTPLATRTPKAVQNANWVMVPVGAMMETPSNSTKPVSARNPMRIPIAATRESAT